MARTSHAAGMDGRTTDITTAEGTVFAYEVLENVEAVRRGGRRRIRYSPTAMVARERIINESDHENGQRPGSTRP